jgi:hypothetical protein
MAVYQLSCPDFFQYSICCSLLSICKNTKHPSSNPKTLFLKQNLKPETLSADQAGSNPKRQPRTGSPPAGELEGAHLRLQTQIQTPRLMN